MGERPVVIVSNRGPVSFRRDDTGALVPRRGAGGLVSGIGPIVRSTDTAWIAAAFSDGDRAMSPNGVLEAEGFRVHLLDIDERTWDLHYNAVCNEALWFASLQNARPQARCGMLLDCRRRAAAAHARGR